MLTSLLQTLIHLREDLRLVLVPIQPDHELLDPVTQLRHLLVPI